MTNSYLQCQRDSIPLNSTVETGAPTGLCTTACRHGANDVIVLSPTITTVELHLRCELTIRVAERAYCCKKKFKTSVSELVIQIINWPFWWKLQVLLLLLLPLVVVAAAAAAAAATAAAVRIRIKFSTVNFK